jgi:hypothetical protein
MNRNRLINTMNLFHFFSVSILALGFSGRPLPVAKKIVPTEIVAPVAKPEESNDFIPWSLDQRLIWEDFQCEPKKGTDAVASTSTTLGIAYEISDGHMTYDITCNFSKQKSWGLMKTDYILAHEQGHFDITEIFARKLHQALQNYVFNKRTFKKDINEIYQSVVKEKEEFQKAYDEQTDHSRNRKVQYEWLNQIQQLLDETQPYSAYP